MTDYIKREDAQSIITELLSGYITDESRDDLEKIEVELAELPSADVVEVVRCKDCKYWQDQEEGIVEVPICTRSELISIRGKDDYCSYGERTDVRENVKGTWKIYCDEKGVVEDCYCDQCGSNSVIGGNFCPNCGADMRGEA